MTRPRRLAILACLLSLGGCGGAHPAATPRRLARRQQARAGRPSMSLAGSDQSVREAAWRQLPSVYVRGSEDRMPEALASGFLEHATEVIELPTGHCPNWSRPDLVAALLAERVRSVDL